MRVVTKADKKQQIVYGEVYAPGILDSDMEFMDEDTIRQMAYNFMRTKKLDQIDSQHSNELVEGAFVVESFIAREDDSTFIPGSWVVGVHIPNKDDWDKVEKGEWNGFSVEAMVVKESIQVTVDIPPVIQGKTFKSEDGHEHLFYVSYDSDGKFLGGVTSPSSGHVHKICRGTITEVADGHNHRFSHVDNLILTELP